MTALLVAMKAAREALTLALENWKLVAVVALLAVTFWAGKHYSDSEHAALRAELKASYNTKVAQLEVDLASAKADGIAAIAKKEREKVEAMAKLDADYQKEIADAVATRERTIADLRAGAIRVREHLTCGPAKSPFGGSPSGKAGTGTGVGDGSAQGGLSGADVELVLRIASEADEVVRQLTRCQQIIRDDRAGQYTTDHGNSPQSDPAAGQ